MLKLRDYIPHSTAARLNRAAQETKFEAFTQGELAELREAFAIIGPLASLVRDTGWDELRRQRDELRKTLINPTPDTAGVVSKENFDHSAVEAAAVIKRKAAKRGLKAAMAGRVAPVCVVALSRLVTWLEGLVETERRANVERARRYELTNSESELILLLRGRVEAAKLALEQASACADGRASVVGSVPPWLAAFGELLPAELRSAPDVAPEAAAA